MEYLQFPVKVMVLMQVGTNGSIGGCRGLGDITGGGGWM